jgi:predicted ATPase with chaperone activity
MTNQEINFHLIVAGFTTSLQTAACDNPFICIFCERRKQWAGNYTEEGNLYYRNISGVYQKHESTRDITRILELLDG